MEQEIKFTVKTTAKLQTEKQRDPRPSVWLSVFKWLFAGFLSISFLVCVVTSKISLLAIGMYYNGTRIPHKSNLGINPASKETTFIMMVLILMIPQSLCLVKACWVSLFRSSHPWPSNSAIIWCLIAGLMEVTGLSFLVTVIVLQSTLTAPHCILIMNALFLIPIIWQLIELRVRIRDKRWTFTFLALAFMLEIIGISLLTYHVIKKENYPEFAGIPASLILLSLAWCPKIQKLQTVPRLNDKINDDNGSVQSKEEETGPSTADPKPANTNYAEDDLGNKTTAREKSTVISRFWKLLTPYVTVRRNDNMNNHLIQMIALGGAQSTDEEAGPSNNNPEPANTNNAEDDHGNKKTARGKSTVISSFWKLLLTPFVAALFCYIFKVADLNALQKGFENFDKGHAIYHFVAQLCSSLLGYIFAKLACSMCIQRVAFALPLTLATPISVALIYIPSICATTAIPFTCNITDNNYVIPLAICLWIAQFLSTGFYVWKGQTFIMAKESSLFWLPYYNGAFLEQYLLLNRKNQITDEYQVNQREIAKKSCVYICTTMYHETENEMEQLLHSLHDIDMARQASESQFEAHILFDGAVKGDVLNDFVLQLIALVPKTLKVKIDRCMKIKTPYGLQLRWKLLGGMPFVIHLKDNLKVKNKKRWSQVMYMSYVLDYKEKMMDSNDDNTYILATDADVKFTHESVQALLDLMMRNPRVGAVCGRTHPLGSGPIVWYQVFDYAIGHWFQKVANHVLGSVLCSPGCFSVYRARAIREVLPIYVSGVNTSVDFLTKDMGEDRWLCTLMVQSGWRLEYCAAAEDSTYCPETFDEFFKQRRRWISSTIANLIQLIRKWRTTLENNDKISIFFIFYQALMVFSTIISPATVILVITGALHHAKIGIEDEVVTLVLLVLVTVGFAIICLYTKQDFQLKVAKLLTIVFALIMAFVTVGMAAQIAADLVLRKKCLGLSKGALHAVNNYTTPSPTGESLKCPDDGLPAELSSLYLAGLVGIFLLAALMHPFEAYCLLHGVWYLFCLPSGYLLLIIYSVCNLTDRSWGTRETKEKKLGDSVPWYKEIWNKLKNMCFCCRRPEAKPGEEISNDNSSSEDNKAGPSAEAPSNNGKESPLTSPPPPASVSNQKRISGDDESPEMVEPKPVDDRLPEEVKEISNDNSSSEDNKAGPSAEAPSNNRKKSPLTSPPPPASVSNQKRISGDDESPGTVESTSVEEWLPEKLKEYKGNFEEHGYDNVSFIVEMTDEDLQSIGITKRGHRMELEYLIKKLPPCPLAQEVSKSVNDWLDELGLKDYWDKFKKTKYTEPPNLEDLKAMDTKTLRKTLKHDMGMTKEAHVTKMIKAIKNLQYPPPVSESPETVWKKPVEDWLPEELKEYKGNFEEHGYDNVSFIVEMTDEDLQFIGVTKPGHRMQLAHLIRKLPPSPLAQEVPKSVKDWLDELGLKDYWEKFEKTKYTEPRNLEDLKAMDTKTLRKILKDGMGMTKRAHVAKMIKAIKNPQYPTPVELPKMVRKKSVEDWLPEELKKKYLQNFKKNGYDNVSFIVGMTDKDLQSIGITKRSYRMQLAQLIKKLPPCPLAEDEPESVKDWLDELGLKDYWEKFENNGYTEPRILEDLKAMDDQKLRKILEKDMSMTKRAHVAKMIKAIENLQYATPDESPETVRKKPVEDWLPEKLKKKYLQNFKENGYDNVSFIVGMNDKDLQSIGITKYGHRMQLSHLIKRLPPCPLPQDEPEKVEDWLHELGLKSYWRYFDNTGYTEPRILEDLKAMDTETLRQILEKDMRMTKRAHVTKMIKAIKNLQYATPVESPETLGKKPIEDWLPEELKEYKRNFEDHGYDNVSFIVEMTEEDLKSIGITKRGHRMQLSHLIKRLPPCPLPQDVPESVKDWLDELGLKDYWEKFENNGYTEPRILEGLKAKDTEKLRKILKDDMSMTKPAHVAKMIKAIKNLQYPTPGQSEIIHAREAINKVGIQPLEETNSNKNHEYKFWKGLLETCLLPESPVFGAETEKVLKKKLEDLRDSALMVFAVANAIWIIILVTLNKQENLKLLGTNAIGFAFLVIFGFILVIQFLTLIWHRLSTICHMLARAPWKRGPYQMSWSFNDANLPDPTKTRKHKKN